MSMFTLHVSGHSFTVVWDANTETNLAGYKVYVQSGSFSDVYDVPVSSSPSQRVSFSDAYDYMIIYVTAYNTDEIESDPSDTVYWFFADLADTAVPYSQARIDGRDLFYLAASFGASVGDPHYNKWADLNDDGRVDGFDLALFGLHFGETIPAQP